MRAKVGLGGLGGGVNWRVELIRDRKRSWGLNATLEGGILKYV